MKKELVILASVLALVSAIVFVINLLAPSTPTSIADVTAADG